PRSRIAKAPTRMNGNARVELSMSAWFAFSSPEVPWAPPGRLDGSPTTPSSRCPPWRPATPPAPPPCDRAWVSTPPPRVTHAVEVVPLRAELDLLGTTPTLVGLVELFDVHDPPVGGTRNVGPG